MIKEETKKDEVILPKKDEVILPKKDEVILPKKDEVILPKKDEVILPKEETKKIKKYKKEIIPKKVKSDLWREYFSSMNALCPCCEKTPISNDNFDASHILAEKQGGETTINNLFPLCSQCNKSMGQKNMYDYFKYYKKNLNEIIKKLKEKKIQQSTPASVNTFANTNVVTNSNSNIKKFSIFGIVVLCIVLYFSK
jgi:hypothetical protein